MALVLRDVCIRSALRVELLEISRVPASSRELLPHIIGELIDAPLSVRVVPCGLDSSAHARSSLCLLLRLQTKPVDLLHVLPIHPTSRCRRSRGRR
jgi:hypothetical protein